MSRYHIGAEFTNQQGAVFRLTRKCAEPRYWEIKFDSGFTTVAKETNILYGKVKDYWRPSVYGVGYLGATFKLPPRSSSDLLRRKYDLWANMLKRVYGNYADKWNADYSDVEVCPTWHNFLVFAEDVQHVPNYEAWVNNSCMCLDKDLARGRLYSKSTCVFITNEENLSEASLRRWHG